MTEPYDYEFYRTPEFFTRWLAEALGDAGVDELGTILEPCVGDGAIVDVLGKAYPKSTFLTNDFDPRWPADQHLDVRDPLYWRAFLPGMVDTVVTNPPFSAAAAILQHALPIAEIVILHVRATFHEPLKTGVRKSLLREHPPLCNLWLPRVSFRRNAEGKPQSDSTCTCWMVWAKVGNRVPSDTLPANLYAPDWVIEAAQAYRPSS